MRVVCRRQVVAITAAICTAAATLTALASSSVAAVPRPTLAVKSSDDSITIRVGNSHRVELYFGTYVEAGDAPFEIWSERTSYFEPITANRKAHGRSIPLDGLALKDFRGLPAFIKTVVRNSSGVVVVNRTQAFCPNTWDPTRARVDAPMSSPYPQECPWNPYTLGSVWGIEAGYGVRTPWSGSAVLHPGRYTATVSVASRYRDMFDIPDAAAATTVTFRVVERTRATEGIDEFLLEGGSGTSAPEPRASEPKGSKPPPAGGRLLPDLRSLPVFGMETFHRSRTGRDYMAFGSNVWNAGATPLVVDGFRREGEAVMDAYQYFYDADGEAVGYDEVGEMAWDARDGHHHWHFLDFARYRLLDADKSSAVRSSKQSFCLANTDAVDYTVPGADWLPYNTDLHSSCGGRTATSVREVLSSGSGDTYYQYLPGQSFDITNLPNGTYYVEVTANPFHRLYESDKTNNVSYRKVYLRGTTGARRVVVPQLGLVTEDR